MITDPLERATKMTQLKEAQDAYHNLATGQMARVVVDQNGERVEFAQPNKQSLYNYIIQLKVELGIGPVNSCRPIGPAGFYF